MRERESAEGLRVDAKKKMNEAYVMAVIACGAGALSLNALAIGSAILGGVFYLLGAAKRMQARRIRKREKK